MEKYVTVTGLIFGVAYRLMLELQ